MVGRLTSGCPWTNPSLNCIFCVCLKCNSSGISHIHLSTVFLKCISNNICIPNCIHMSTIFPIVFLKCIPNSISQLYFQVYFLSRLGAGWPQPPHGPAPLFVPSREKTAQPDLIILPFQPPFLKSYTIQWKYNGNSKEIHWKFPQGRKLLRLILSFYLFNPSFANIATSS